MHAEGESTHSQTHTDWTHSSSCCLKETDLSDVQHDFLILIIMRSALDITASLSSQFDQRRDEMIKLMKTEERER